ncbi:MAG: 4-hydroxy-3-methylbut-2-enyl diphosphate reductase, partial [Clostridiales bacterium]|nr:4-hydroxy-3-methylbut-2-enyl diphosphate reductase [Clostridiales bacterium]
MLKVRVASNAGFCFGVQRAVNSALNHGYSGEQYMLGDITHNKTVIDMLHARGLKTVESVDELPMGDGNGCVVIRSHGTDKATYDQIAQKGYNIIDATCPFVAKIHDIVSKHYEAGYHIVIIGEAAHPEVIATDGWCNNTATVIDLDSDLSVLQSYDKLCIVCQTTFDGQKYKKLCEKISKIQLKTVEIFDTICYTTYERQKEAVLLAKNCDLVLVVGDRSSSNTNKL